MRVAVVQLSAGADRTANRLRAVGAAEAAASLGARLVVLPEAAMADFDDFRTPLASLAEPLDGPFVSALGQVAHTRGITVIAGTFEPGPDTERVYNTLVVVGPGGLVERYRKIHLYDALGWTESAHVAPGDPAATVVIDVDGWKIGLMTCFDLRFPEVGRALVDQGASAVAVPAAWVTGPLKAEQWSVLLRARAIEDTAWVLAAAQPAPHYTGFSQIVGPDGQVVAAAGPLDDAGDHLGARDGRGGLGGAVLVADLDRGSLEGLRRGMPVLALRRFAVRPS
jgi:predicted amidohydrolase